MTFCGDLPFVPSGIHHHLFENPRRKASLPRPDAPVLGRTQNFYRVLGKNFVGCSFTLDSQCGRLCISPGDRGLNRCMAPDTTTGRHPPQRRRARARNGVALTSRRPLPGCQERRPRRDRGGATVRSLQARVFTHRTVATARNRASGFGGDWQVRQQLPVGVGPDDRMPPGSREPKVRPADRTTLQ